MNEAIINTISNKSMFLFLENQRKRTKRFIHSLIICSVLSCYSTVSSAQITINIQNESIKSVLEKVEKQSGYKLFYSENLKALDKKISKKFTNQSIEYVLTEIFKDAGISYQMKENNLIVLTVSAQSKSVEPKSQQLKKRITGTVIDTSGEAIIGANVVIKGKTTNGTITDLDGKFSLDVSSNTTIIISYIGYVNQEVAIKEKSSLIITMRENSKMLDEMVVTALGMKRSEKALGYAVQKVDGNSLSTVKSIDVGTALTGKIAGLNINNSSEFNSAPSFSLRGESPLIVIDGVPYYKISMRDIATDDIASIDVLKGATASALYGARGGSGAIMVTTKRGQKEGLDIQINSSTMFNAGFLKIPESQISYSMGMDGQYNPSGHMWGDKLDIGRVATQLNPKTGEWEEMALECKGPNNFENFLEFSFLTNNNLSISQKGKYGSFRTSLTHIYNKGQYPGQKLNKLTYSVSGDMKFGNLNIEGGLTYNKRFYPNNNGTGYGKGGYIYNLLVWSGADLDIRDFKDYWKVKDQEQIWPNKSWLDNPYFIANEISHSSNYDILNGFFSLNYTIVDWMKLSLREGVESYSEKETWKNGISARGGWNKKGYYREKNSRGFSSNTDLILTMNKKIGNISLDGFLGGTIYYYQNDYLNSNTQNGLSIPGYFSLYASVDPLKVTTEYNRKQVNSLYGNFSAAYKSTLFVDVTARNDWSSSLPNETRSYFYPSVSGSLVVSEILKMPKWIPFWKIRASWTKTKKDLDIYESNAAYSISTGLWDGLSGATYPTSIKDPLILPSETTSYEIGTAVSILEDRLRLDLSYYNKLYSNLTYKAPISETTGFSTSLINIDEERIRRGVEISLDADIITNSDFTWNMLVNWSSDRLKYSKIDPIYSSQRNWVKKGERVDHFTYYDWERDNKGNIIHQGGYPLQSKYASLGGYSGSDWMFGITNSFTYKNFTLGFSIDGRVGGVAHAVTEQALWMTGAHIESDNQWRYEEVVNRNKTYVGEGVEVVSGSVDWDVNGDIINDTRVFAPNSQITSYETYMKLYHGAGNVWGVKHQHILDQTFVKLRDISLTYKIPKTALTKLKIQDASVSLIGNNLLIWTKDFKFSDPDVGKENLNSPSLRMIGCNIKINF